MTESAPGRCANHPLLKCGDGVRFFSSRGFSGRSYCFRLCEECAQEILTGDDVELTADEYLVAEVMES